jgi:hypothetical protein
LTERSILAYTHVVVNPQRTYTMRITLDTNTDDFDEHMAAVAAVRAFREERSLTTKGSTTLGTFSDELHACREAAQAPVDTDAATGPLPAFDSEGLPWDERIHSTPASISKISGRWRARRNVQPLTVSNVTVELRAAGRVSVPAPPVATAVPAPPTPPVATAVPAPPTPPVVAAVPAPPVVAAVPAPPVVAAVPAPPVAAGVSAAEIIAAGKALPPGKFNETLNAFGIANLGALFPPAPPQDPAVLTALLAYLKTL